MKRVLIESPYGSREQSVIVRNEAYARACMADAFRRGEAPYASHLLYTQKGVLRDNVPTERALGIEAGLVWGSCAELTVVYADLGITPGMQKGINRARREGRPIVKRRLDAWVTVEAIEAVMKTLSEECPTCDGEQCLGVTREGVIEFCRRLMADVERFDSHCVVCRGLDGSHACVQFAPFDVVMLLPRMTT